MTTWLLWAFVNHAFQLWHFLDAMERCGVPSLRHGDVAFPPCSLDVAGKNVLNFSERQVPEVLTVPADDFYPFRLQRKPVYAAFAFGGFFFSPASASGKKR